MLKMDRHKRLYKESMQSPRQHNRINRDRQLATRVQQRKDAYQSSRNFVVSPTPCKEKQPRGENKENAEVPTNGVELVENASTSLQVNKSRIAVVACGSTNSQKLSRQEAFLLRFIEWKEAQKQQKKQEDRKPPFISSCSAVCARNKDAAAASSSSFVPKSHNKFKPPAGLKNPALEKVAPANNCANNALRKSFYTVVPTPKKVKSELAKTASVKSTTSSAKTTANGAIISGSNVKPFVKPRQPHFPRPTQQPSAAVPKANAPIVKPVLSGAVAKKPGSSITTGAVGKAHMLQRKRDAQAPKAAPTQRNAKLAVSLKAKKPAGTSTTTNHSAALAAAIKRTVEPAKFKNKSRMFMGRPACRPAAASAAVAETPTDPTQVNPFGAFVTSTKVKSVSPRADRTLSGIGDTISPVEATQNQVGSKVVDKPLPVAGRTLSNSSSVKRALLQNNGRDEGETESRTKRKFNFVRFSVGQAELDLSGMEPQEESLIATNDEMKQVRDATLVPQSPSPQSPPTSELQNGESAAERAANYLSPYVSVSRGKVSSKQERERRNSVYLQLPPETAATTSPPPNVETRRTLETVRYFRQQLASETERLLALCATWEQYKQQELPRLEQTGGDDMINVAVGQTKLLTSKKFQQFSGLIDRCEAGVRSAAAGLALVDDGSEKTKPITAVDLEGFWSMLGLQVDNVEKRFESLERWKANDWCDPAEVSAEAASAKPKPKLKPTLNRVKKTKPAVGKTAKPSSGLQEMLRQMHAEMRRNKAAAAAGAPKTACDTNIPSTPTQRRQRPSQGGTPRSSNTNRRISVVVRDRKLFSPAATVISIPAGAVVQRRLSRSSLTRIPMSTVEETAPSMRRGTEELRSSIGKFQKACDRTELLRTALVGSTCNSGQKQRCETRTPQQISPPPSVGQHGRKSILKTPGTAKSKPKNVNFNEQLRIKKFTFTLEDEHSDDDEPETEEQMQSHSSVEGTLSTGSSIAKRKKSLETDGERMYSLRTRKVVLRPSSEFQIPK